jgi:hypothetical protein
LKRQFIVAALSVAVGLAATCIAMGFGQLASARACCIVVFGGMARVIYLCIARQRRFMAIKTVGGMTRRQALSEFNSRSG